ncbi:16S rRNA (cytosine(1402)-N(4))-methyltransferase [Veillonella denticariosi JCM 15641]|uniref:16S rRNA (Cytosine(1402)-N(4))-methyltransferase n=1 Tax=Veillonella denticariosi JCM 15641 TaxID=1298594 RepID=A0A2S7Z752_9FIRM|nr:class I SAM-dependent methyltransferase [Veillonella denticariosi]PQL19118.1 16S rRNA (cytosine(1402)-N(4))-methyltransferase [Veillonella denticariosi JCM 15641]
MININNAVQFQHLIWDRVMTNAKVVVDATCGNGHDLLYLAERAQKGCHLYGIDIQMQAINTSKELLRSNGIAQDVSLTFIHRSHDKALSEDIKDNDIDLMIFNLGYLPGSNHQIITEPHHTINAIQEGLGKLDNSGVITVVAYPGTEEGLAEKEYLQSYLKNLNQKLYNVCHWQPMNQVNQPPELFILQKR